MAAFFAAACKCHPGLVKEEQFDIDRTFRKQFSTSDESSTLDSSAAGAGPVTQQQGNLSNPVLIELDARRKQLDEVSAKARAELSQVQRRSRTHEYNAFDAKGGKKLQVQPSRDPLPRTVLEEHRRNRYHIVDYVQELAAEALEAELLRQGGNSPGKEF
jgi:hypothetical protein